MPLSKQICLACNRESDERPLRGHPESRWMGHDEIAESYWAEGRAYCYWSGQWWISIRGNPPPECPYFLEHIVLHQEPKNSSGKISPTQDSGFHTPLNQSR